MIKYIEDNIGFVSLVRQATDPGLEVVNAARISYGTDKQQFDSKDKKLVNYLFEHDHTSPFRHTFYTFHVKATLSVFRQWIKYQVGSLWRTYETSTDQPNNTISIDLIDLFFDTDKGCSWNEISRRYTEPKEEYYLPSVLRSNPPHGNKQSSGQYINPIYPSDLSYLQDPIDSMREHTKASIKLYKQLIANGVAREQARDILPQNIYSEAYWTVSLQGLMHFLSQRTKPDAQYEIRMYALLVKEILAKDLANMGITIN
jgi:thymidylate synthase (FAD)